MGWNSSFDRGFRFWGVSMLFWLGDALFGAFLARSDPFWNLLLFEMPPANLASRLLVIGYHSVWPWCTINRGAGVQN